MTSNTKWIIVKYAAESYHQHTYAPDYKFTLGDSAHLTFTARQVGGLPRFFDTEQEGKPFLEKMIESNPSVGYDLVEIEIEI
jgi:hypothetical protein